MNKVVIEKSVNSYYKKNIVHGCSVPGQGERGGGW